MRKAYEPANHISHMPIKTRSPTIFAIRNVDSFLQNSYE